VSNTIVIILVAIMMPFSFPLMSVGGGWDGNADCSAG
jgi:hypothetical protein